MLTGCATSQLHKDARFIQPGVTTRAEVWDALGPAHRVVQGEASETLHYVERGRNPLKGAYTGAVATGAFTGALIIADWFVYPPVLLLAPFAIAAAAALGAIGGAVVGSVVKMEFARLEVEVGEDGKVMKVEK
jgi:hypothetical protein